MGIGNDCSRSRVEVRCDAFDGGGETTMSICWCDLRTGLNEGSGRASGVRGAGELLDDDDSGLGGSKSGQLFWGEREYCGRECAFDGV